MAAEFITKLTKGLNTVAASFVILLLAVISKSLIAWVYSDLEGDQSLYLLMAQALLEKGVIAEPVLLFETGASRYLFNPAVYSPLYSLLAAPVLWMSGSAELTQIVLAILGWLVFYSGLFFLLLKFFPERWQANLFLLFTAFFLYPHVLASTPKDSLAAGFLAWSIFYAESFFQKPSWKNSLLLVLSLVAVALTKLLYLPPATLLLGALLFFVLKEQKLKFYLQTVLVSGAMVLTGALLFVLVFIPLKPLLSQPINLMNDGTTFIKGFYPSNLSMIFPFISASVLNTGFWGVQLQPVFQVAYSKIILFFRWADLLVMATLLFSVVTGKLPTRLRRISWFILIPTMVQAMVVIYLSLRYEAYSFKSSTYVWTYVADARSFLFTMVALQVFLFFLLIGNKLPRLISLLLIGLLAVTWIHGVYFATKLPFQTSRVAAEKMGNSNIKQVVRFVQEQPHAGLITTDNFLRRFAALKGVKTYLLRDVQAVAWMAPNRSFIVATHSADSNYLVNIPAGTLILQDSIGPFMLHRFTAR